MRRHHGTAMLGSNLALNSNIMVCWLLEVLLCFGVQVDMRML